MGENSGIGWTDHTYNPWRGCTKYGPGCDWCYAEARDLKYESGKGATDPAHWGKGKPRIRAAAATLALPFKIAKMIATGAMDPKKNKVFTLSLGDWADEEVDPVWRADLFQTIRETPTLRYQMVTKRAEAALRFLPDDWEANFGHCGVILTVVTQKELDRDAPTLRKIKERTRWVGLSIEPQLEGVDIEGCGDFVDWAITGGESKQSKEQEPRVYNLEWALGLIGQGKRSGTTIFVKQLGSNPYSEGRPMHGGQPSWDSNEKPDRWPERLRVQDFPEALR